MTTAIVTTPPSTTTRPPTNVGGTAIKTALADSQTAGLLLQAYTETVLRTPDIILDSSVNGLSNSTVVQDLPTHQATARSHASDYIHTINPLIYAKSADIIGFGNLWNTEFPRLITLANTIDAPGVVDQFKQGLTNLVNQAERKHDACQVVIDALNAFLPGIQLDRRNIETDAQNVAIALGGVKGAIKLLQDRLDADNAAISKDIGMIAGGAVADVVGALMIVVGVAAEVVTGGAATALVLGGIAVVAGGSVMMGIAGANLAKTQTDLFETTRTLSIDQACFVGSTQAAKTVAALDDSISKAINSVISLQKGWAALSGDLTQVIDQLDQASPDLGSWLVDILNAANTDWTDALKLATDLQSYGTLPVKTVQLAQAA